MSNCLICESTLEGFLDLGLQPSANAFVSKEQLNSDEYRYQLQVGFCQNCTMIQTLERPKKEAMFKENYAYFTSSNAPMVKHFKDYAEHVKNNILTEKSVIFEIGSNDGVFLKHFNDYKHLGFEPSKNVCEIAQEKGVNCTTEFFNKENALKQAESLGKADFIFAANVIGHVEEIKSVLEGVKSVLNEKGQFVIEIYYLPSMLKRKTFDLIYDEHIFYYTLMNINNMLSQFEMELFDVDFIPVHGGSIRAYISHKNSYAPSPKLLEAIEEEKKMGLKSLDPLHQFAKDVEKTKTEFRELIKELKSKNKTIAGYGATAKSTTLINYCELTNQDIDFIVDSTPVKQGTFSPGAHIPIVEEAELLKRSPDYTVLFAWNYKDQIIQKQEEYTNSGGKWIIFHPEVGVINE